MDEWMIYYNWRTLRSQVVRLAKLRLGELLDWRCPEPREGFGTWLREEWIGAGEPYDKEKPNRPQRLRGLVREMAQRLRETSSGKSAAPHVAAMWACALSHFDQPERLAIALEENTFLCGNQVRTASDRKTKRETRKVISSDQALSEVVRDYLGEARIRILGPEHPARLKTWERLNTLSLELARNIPENSLNKLSPEERAMELARKITENRCNRVHYQEILDEIKRRFPNDKNLPRTPDGIEAYFQEFCPDCQQDITDEEGKQDFDAHHQLPWFFRSEKEIGLCVKKLSKETGEALAVNWDFGNEDKKDAADVLRTMLELEDIRYARVDDYLKTRVISAREYTSRWQQATRQLLECLKGVLGL